MRSSDGGIPVQILDREFLVACSEEEKDDVVASAKFVNDKIDEIRRGSRIIGSDRLVVLAALNLANDLLHVKAERDHYAQSMDRLVSLQNRIESVLSEME